MPDPSWRRFYPFQTAKLLLEGHHLHYVDQGSGSPLLMVHGNPTWSFYWRNLIAAFRDRYRAVAVDHIGCGLSDKPTAYDYTLSRHIANLSRLVEHLDLRDITLLVHDWGGPIGLGAALESPHRYSRIVLFNTGAFPPWYIPRRIAICRTPLLGPLAVQGLNLFAKAALFMAVADRRRLSKEAKQGLLAPYHSWGKRRAILEFVYDIPRSKAHPTWSVLEHIEKGLPSLADRPVQINWGMKDWCFTPACLERFEQIFPSAEVNRFHDAGHYVIEEEHERIINLVDAFLTQTPAADRP